MQPESTEPQVQPLPAIPASERERIYADVRAGEIPSVSPAMEAVNNESRLRVYMPVDAKNLDDEQAVLDAQAEKLAIKRREHESLVAQWESLLLARDEIRVDITNLGEHRTAALEAIEVKGQLVQEHLLSGAGFDFQVAAGLHSVVQTLQSLVDLIDGLIEERQLALPQTVLKIQQFALAHHIEP